MRLLFMFLLLDTIVLVKKEGINEKNVRFWSKKGPKSNKMIHVVNFAFINSVFDICKIFMVKKEGINDENVLFLSKRWSKSNKMIHVGNSAFINQVFDRGHDSSR